MAYEIFKDLNTRTASHNVLRDKLFNIAKNPKYEEYQRGLPSQVFFFFLIRKIRVELLKMKIL